MKTTFCSSRLCNIPGVFYPTTILSVDDDQVAIDAVIAALAGYYKTISFLDSNKALDFLTDKTGKFFRGRAISNKIDEGVLGFRKEAYNDKRFDDVLIAIIDYDMPEQSGFDVWQNVGLNDYYQSHEHSYILFTAKKYSDFQEELANEAVGKNFISKFDPNHPKYLIEAINKLSTGMFQRVGHGIANILNHDESEKTSFLNDGNFLSILNPYLQEHDICEGYLFDKQGSLMFLDNKANLSWLFVRNEQGVQNSIERARTYGAPDSVIASLKSKEMILSLYEKEDFESRKSIDWDKYLLKASVFKDEGKKLEIFEHRPSDYYYAFTDIFPEHGIDKDKILSYDDFLRQK